MWLGLQSYLAQAIDPGGSILLWRQRSQADSGLWRDIKVVWAILASRIGMGKPIWGNRTKPDSQGAITNLLTGGFPFLSVSWMRAQYRANVIKIDQATGLAAARSWHDVAVPDARSHPQECN